MRIVDAMTGVELTYPAIGRRIPSTDVTIQTLEVCGPFFWPTSATLITTDGLRVPLVLRFMHPKYLFQWVAFIPS